MTKTKAKATTNEAVEVEQAEPVAAEVEQVESVSIEPEDESNFRMSDADVVEVDNVYGIAELEHVEPVVTPAPTPFEVAVPAEPVVNVQLPTASVGPKQVDLNKYAQFVEGVTSDQSNETSALVNQLESLQNGSGVNMALLLTGSIGMASEGGEFAEIVKKCIFQGKPLDDATIFHAKRELGDIAWYWVNSCRALNLDPNEVLAENVNKLKARYPGGEFDVHYSENRKDGDL